MEFLDLGAVSVGPPRNRVKPLRVNFGAVPR